MYDAVMCMREPSVRCRQSDELLGGELGSADGIGGSESAVMGMLAWWWWWIDCHNGLASRPTNLMATSDFCCFMLTSSAKTLNDRRMTSTMSTMPLTSLAGELDVKGSSKSSANARWVMWTSRPLSWSRLLWSGIGSVWKSCRCWGNFLNNICMAKSMITLKLVVKRIVLSGSPCSMPVDVAMVVGGV
eukprot:6482411-Amphidinium_carterae.1